jgi:hypothetical protein
LKIVRWKVCILLSLWTNPLRIDLAGEASQWDKTKHLNKKHIITVKYKQYIRGKYQLPKYKNRINEVIWFILVSKVVDLNHQVIIKMYIMNNKYIRAFVLGILILQNTKNTNNTRQGICQHLITSNPQNLKTTSHSPSTQVSTVTY